MFPNRLSDNIDVESFRHQERVHEQIRTYRRFSQKKLSRLVRALTEGITSEYHLGERL